MLQLRASTYMRALHLYTRRSSYVCTQGTARGELMYKFVPKCIYWMIKSICVRCWRAIWVKVKPYRFLRLHHTQTFARADNSLLILRRGLSSILYLALWPHGHPLNILCSKSRARIHCQISVKRLHSCARLLLRTLYEQTGCFFFFIVCYWYYIVFALIIKCIEIINIHAMMRCAREYLPF